MAGGEERALQRRIRSIESTRKTTRAMELIAASRIVRAQNRITQARPYVERLDQLAADIAAAPGGAENPLLQPPDPALPRAVVVIASDRGLCGGYNTFVLRAAEHVMRQSQNGDSPAGGGRQIRLVAVGRRAVSSLRYRGYRIDHSFIHLTDQPTADDARRVAATVEDFNRGELGQVQVVSTRFRSAGVQRVEVRQLVPLAEGDVEKGRRFDYELEPERSTLLDRLAPRLVEARLYLALLEAAASEHAARQRAMKAATDNADDLITTLRRIMNRARQDAITTEIMDIVGGAEALRAGQSRPGWESRFESENHFGQEETQGNARSA
jgi:F-type H+-transporting ATPase subunit gamma